MPSVFDPKKRFAVILLNLGGPDSVKAVRPFLRNLFSDRKIIKLPLQPIFARIISRARAGKVVARYQAIGGGSPIVKLTEDQAAGVEQSLKVSGFDCKVYVGMSYWHPFIREAVDRAERDGFHQILAFSLFPHYSGATTGACVGEVRDIVKNKPGLALETIETWYDDAGYIGALTAAVRAGLDKFTPDERRDLTILFSAHSLPQEFVDTGDPYPDHIKVTIEKVLEGLEQVKWRLAYQSRSGPVKWMEPQTDAVIAEMGDAGVKNVLVVPVSFVSDHIETLYEVDIMYKALAHSRGIERFERSPSLNSADEFIQALTGLAARKVASLAGAGASGGRQ